MILRIGGILLGVAAGLAVGLGAMIVVERPNGGAVYSLAALQAGLAREPRDWVNRIVRVRAVATGCTAWAGSVHLSPCIDEAAGLYDAGSMDTSTYTPVADGAPDPWLSLLRRLPLLGSLAPPAQRLRRGAPATYRVRLRVAPTGLCADGICVTAVLLDAAPDPE